jgi:hypothetical protein
MRAIPLWLEFQRETGKKIAPDKEFQITREKGRWFIDIDDQTALRFGQFIPAYDNSKDYREWLEEKIETLENKLNP